MYELSVKAHFDAAHHLNDYEGPCARLHGHRWEVQAVWSIETLKANGLAEDFKVLKNRLQIVCKELDHQYLNNLPFLSTLPNPTAECLAAYIYTMLEDGNLKEVSVWESPECCVTYRKEVKLS